MKLNSKITKSIIGLFTVIFLIIAFSTTGYTTSLNWEPYGKALDLAKKNKKFVFINFYADWCMYCKKMEHETFRDRDVQKFLNKYFVSVRINTDKRPRLAAYYMVRGLPTFWFLDETGNPITNLSGYIPPRIFLTVLKFIQTKSYKDMEFNEFMKKLLSSSH